VGCRQVQAKRSLIRVVRSPEGVVVDPDGKLSGRGAYLHDARSCWQKGLSGRLAHALKTEINAKEMAVLEEFMQSLPSETADDPVDNASA
jgi:predicted RNA-binding protein YlxR (DUF448 family)